MTDQLELIQPVPQSAWDKMLDVFQKSGATADQIASLIDSKIKWDKHEAKLEYEASMAQFNRELPVIFKTKKVIIPTSRGDNMTYSHAELDKAADIVREALTRVRVRPSWKPEDNNGRMVMNCVFTHENGHSEIVATLSGPADTSGGKNTVQAIGSTVTYLERYTLLAGAGIAPKNCDDDGKAASGGMPEQSITEYCIKMGDESTWESLKEVFGECYAKAKKLNDKEAMDRLRAKYEARKKEIQEHRQ